MSERLYLIAYDITDPKRLGRVARYMCQHACRIQYSVFAAKLSKAKLEQMLADLENIIDEKQDDIRAYPLPATGEVTLMGQQFFAANTLLVQNGYSRLELAENNNDEELSSKENN